VLLLHFSEKKEKEKEGCSLASSSYFFLFFPFFGGFGGAGRLSNCFLIANRKKYTRETHRVCDACVGVLPCLAAAYTYSLFLMM